MKGDLQCGVGNAEQCNPGVEDDKGSLQKCQEMLTVPTTVLRPVRQWSLLLSYQLLMRKAAYQQCSSSCLQAG